jgi:integrase
MRRTLYRVASSAWKSHKSLTAWEHTLNAFAYPIIGGLPVAAVDTDLVMKVLEPIWTRTPETASRLRGRLEAVLNYAHVKGQRACENPARWKGQLDQLLPARQKVAKTIHHPALPYAELSAFMADLRQQGGTAARALEFTILTAARTGEVIGARWDEIDLEARLWVVPGSRMKAGREHRVPLPDAAMAVLAALPGDRSGRVFIHRKRPLSDMAMLMLLRRMGRDDLTLHGFRSTFSDWTVEKTNAQTEVREMALAHVVDDKTEAAYRRGDLFEKRQQLADAWARYCDGTMDAEKVVPLRRIDAA